jgi:hypothetical protein
LARFARLGRIEIRPENIKCARTGLMNHQTQAATELEALRVLCDEAAPRDSRQKLLQSLIGHSFLEPEHQVVFESIRALFPRGSFSLAQLRVHLNNRGFPDTDVEKYFQVARDGNIEFGPHNKIIS